MKSKVQVRGRTRFGVRSNKWYAEIAQSSRRGKTSLIFNLLEVQANEVRLYTLLKRSGVTEGTSLARWNGTQGLYKTLEQQEQGQMEGHSKGEL